MHPSAYINKMKWLSYMIARFLLKVAGVMMVSLTPSSFKAQGAVVAHKGYFVVASVFDFESEEPLSEVNLKLTQADSLFIDTVYTAQQIKLSGLKYGENIDVLVNAEGYLSLGDSFKVEDTTATEVIREYYLRKIMGPPVPDLHLLFGHNESEIDSAAASVIGNITALLNQYPEMVLKLEGKKCPEEKHNLIEDRQNVLYNELTRRGIEARRLMLARAEMIPSEKLEVDLECGSKRTVGITIVKLN